MSIEVRMPQMGLTMTEGTLVRWLVAPGQAVAKGQILAEIEMEKATTDLESPAAGVVARLAVDEGAVVPVVGLLAVLTEPGEATVQPAVPVDAPTAKPAAPSSAERPGPPAPVPEAEGGQRRASPYARRLAREQGIDIRTLATGSGAGGRIVSQDILARRAPEIIQLAGARAVIAARMAESAHSAAAVTLTTEVDATSLVKLREDLADVPEGLRPPYDAILAKIAAVALREHPTVNARMAGNEIQLLPHVNVAIAVDTPRGLLALVIRQTDTKDIFRIATELAERVGRARRCEATAEDQADGSFTITNLGMHGIDAFTPIINPPQCAVLGIGRILERPAVREGALCIRKTMWLSLTFDHRMIDGAPAARFLERIGHLVAEPGSLPR
jgi:pyruvate dehydrogenase E2 component (dihydrolipoamide acetyltransferase)